MIPSICCLYTVLNTIYWAWVVPKHDLGFGIPGNEGCLGVHGDFRTYGGLNRCYQAYIWNKKGLWFQIISF